MMVGRTSAIAAGLCGALFIGYCIYFDRKRRSDPNFKNRLRERRKKQKLAKERAGLSKLPDLKDAEAVQKFFLEEIQLGEELLAQGEYEKGVDHLTNAIAVCGQPQQLLQVLQQTLPPPVFQMLLTKLPTISQPEYCASNIGNTLAAKRVIVGNQRDAQLTSTEQTFQAAAVLAGLPAMLSGHVRAKQFWENAGSDATDQ
ncbi:Tomm20 [Columba guinea]|nr:Tomm20 [Columba guinea]